MRTEQGAPELNAITNKWSPTFVTYVGIPGSEYVGGKITAPALFDNEDAASEAGSRAMDHLEAHGHFPNMCKAW